MLSRKIFEILQSVMAFLVLLKKFCSNFLPLIRSPSPNMMHFVRTFSIHASLLQARSGSSKFWWGDAILN